MRVECQNKKENEKDCICDELSCSRHGICCECIAHHRLKYDKPACLR